MFGLNNAQLIGRLGADVTVNNLANGGEFALSGTPARAANLRPLLTRPSIAGDAAWPSIKPVADITIYTIAPGSWARERPSQRTG